MEATNMFGAQQEAIFERLATTKKFGLVSEYHVSWSGPSGQLKPKVVVWRNEMSSDEIVQDYVARLLRGLVPAQRIKIGM
jgi:hypothetical protein